MFTEGDEVLVTMKLGDYDMLGHNAYIRIPDGLSFEILLIDTHTHERVTIRATVTKGDLFLHAVLICTVNIY